MIKDDDFGFSAEDDVTFDDTHKVLAENYKGALDKSEDKIGKIVAKITTFLDKLAEDPTKATLKWPNRASVVLKLKNDILTIRNS